MQTPGFDIVYQDETMLILLDLDRGATITNSAEQVVRLVDGLVDGIGKRRLIYRDTAGRYDEILVDSGVFRGFKACSISQQDFLRGLLLKSL
ncbi:MAG: hypothetical protein DI542_13045 [Acinetobacter johnsonii]|uniref:Uncharacterized protein n=2 Tax=Gammaproteobacteria TaxID=1236 RepID=A0A2W5R9K1_ACIJO|nr:MAG: hypothetical protein DI542_13045 [Acinetobacter johnsonii]